MEVDKNYFSKIPEEIFEELDKMSKEKETILNSNKVNENVGIPSINEIKDKNIIKPKEAEKKPVESKPIKEDKKEEEKKDNPPNVLLDITEKNISEIKKALEESNIEDVPKKEEKNKILEDVSEPPKIEDKKEDKEKDEDKEKKKEKDISPVLSAIEKKRYENLGKAFMIGADSAFTEIQNALEKKEQNKLSGKDNVENQIKDAEEKMKKDKKKKSSVMKRIAVAAAALGGLYLLFSGTINSAFRTMYEKIKNGVSGFGDFIKGAASSILHFFGNMFVKAARTLSGGGVLTTLMGGIIWDFFNYTLPKMVITMVEDLVKIIDSSFKSNVTLESRNAKLTNGEKRAKEETENMAEMMKSEMDKFLLSQEMAIRNSTPLTTKQQEEVADKSIAEIKNSFESLLSDTKYTSDVNAKVMRGWSNSVLTMMLSNQLSSTKFYNNASNAVRAIDVMIPNLKTITKDNVIKCTTDAQKEFISNFAKNFGVSLGMSEEEQKSFAKMSTEYQLEVLKTIVDGTKKFTASVDKDILEAEKNADPEESNRGVINILKTMRNDINKKESHIEIIKFQEISAISELNYNIRKFLFESKFLKIFEDFSSSVSFKFNTILDAANQSLANLPRAIASNFVMMGSDGNVEIKNINDSDGTEAVSVPLPDDYKLMYVFNNNVPYMDSIIDKDMTTFLNFSVAYTQLMGQELAVLGQLERLTAILTNGVYYNSEMVRNSYREISESISNHIKTPVSYQAPTAHVLIQKNPSLASNDIPLIASNSGMIII